MSFQAVTLDDVLFGADTPSSRCTSVGRSSQLTFPGRTSVSPHLDPQGLSLTQLLLADLLYFHPHGVLASLGVRL